MHILYHTIMESNFFMNEYQSVIEYIEDIPRFTKKNSLEHTRMFLEKLNIDTKAMKIIHVAGTNGKGSVCAMISGMLVDAGKETGLFVSPHLILHTERIRLNNIPVAKEDFCEAFCQVKKVVEEMQQEGFAHPSYFEFLFLMAMYEFQKQKMEYVILETGLGGRLDATNAVEHPILTVITSIGLDHMEYLGDTIAQIASEKAGIIKDNVPVVYWAGDDEAADVIGKQADKKNAKQIILKETNYKIMKKTDKSVDFSVQSEYYLNDTFSVPFPAEYQVQNALLALHAIAELHMSGKDMNCIKESLKHVKWEGRMEEVLPGVILDGAHNGPGIDAFIQTFCEWKCQGKKKILFSVVRDKDYDYMVSRITKTDVSKIYITQIDSDRGLETNQMEQDFRQNQCKAEIVVLPDIERAFLTALNEKQEDDVLFCVGSLYLVGALKKIV